MFHVVLYEPEIPPNTGNIIRLCANTGTYLHLIHPLGFTLDDKKLRRARLDYDEFARINEYESLQHFLDEVKPHRVFPVSTRGQINYCDVKYERGDAFLFGPETRGLPQTILDDSPRDMNLRIPMKEGNRSLNLSNTTAVIVYEAWRQNAFK